jgi:hypothetical protein
MPLQASLQVTHTRGSLRGGVCAVLTQTHAEGTSA